MFNSPLLNIPKVSFHSLSFPNLNLDHDIKNKFKRRNLVNFIGIMQPFLEFNLTILTIVNPKCMHKNVNYKIVMVGQQIDGFPLVIADSEQYRQDLNQAWAAAII